jgi:hypothetical protein
MLLQPVITLNYGESAMRDKVLSLAAAAALLASVGGAYAKGPVTLTDGQLDTVTAGDQLNSLLALTDFTIAFLSGVPLSPHTASLDGGATGTVTPSASLGGGATGTVTPLALIGGMVTP